MVELGEHCHAHIMPRLKKVMDGEDDGGITKAVNWKGGDGFCYYRLGPSLIVEDEWGKGKRKDPKQQSMFHMET